MLVSTIYVLYGYLSGRNDIAGLLRIVASVAVLSVGMIYVGLEGYQIKLQYSKVYIASLVRICAVSTLIMLCLVMHFAPPATMHVLYRDQARLKGMTFISERLRKYYSKYRRLPENLDTLAGLGGLQEADKVDPLNKPYIYYAIKDKSFDVCTTFEADHFQARRISDWQYWPFPVWHYAAGTQCQRYVIEKDKEGFDELKIIFLNQTQINVQ